MHKSMSQLRPTSLIFGTSTLHRIFFQSDRARLLNECFELGIKAFDTSPFYGDGLAEASLGAVFSDRASLVSISTKIGLPARGAFPGTSLNTRFVKVIQKLSKQKVYGVDLPDNCRFERKNIEKSLDSSQARLRNIGIGTLFLHEPYASEWPQIERLLPFLGDLLTRGVVRQIGLSGYASECLEIHRLSGNFFSNIQIEDDWNLTQTNLLLKQGVKVDAAFGILRNAYSNGLKLDASEMLGRASQSSPDTNLLFSTSKIEHLQNLIFSTS